MRNQQSLPTIMSVLSQFNTDNVILIIDDGNIVRNYVRDSRVDNIPYDKQLSYYRMSVYYVTIDKTDYLKVELYI